MSTVMMFWCFSALSTAIAFSPRPPAPTSTIGCAGFSGITLLIAEYTVMPEHA